MKRKSTIEKIALAAFNNDRTLLNKFKSTALLNVLETRDIKIIHSEQPEDEAKYWLDRSILTPDVMDSINCLRMAVMLKTRSK